jgi:hypothetical protein
MSLGIATNGLLVGDNAALEEQVDEVVAVAAEQGFSFYIASGTIQRGWLKVMNGDVAEGMSLLRSGSTAYRAIGQEAWMPYFIALLAGACEIAGQVEEGLALLDDALQIAKRTGERWFAAELNRRKGELMLRQGQSEPGTLSPSPEHRPGAGGQALGTARRREPGPARPRPGSPRRSPRSAGAGL